MAPIPALVRVEERIDAQVRADLASRGHVIELMPGWREGFVLAVEHDPHSGLLRGGADPRGQLAVLMPAQVIGW